MSGGLQAICRSSELPDLAKDNEFRSPLACPRCSLERGVMGGRRFSKGDREQIGIGDTAADCGIPRLVCESESGPGTCSRGGGESPLCRDDNDHYQSDIERKSTDITPR